MTTDFIPDPGGSAALYGFLYQLAHHLDWLADLRHQKIDFGAASDDAIVIFEPRSGGDAQRLGIEYLVEQYKTRYRSWPFNKLVADVLPDLRRSVKPGRSGRAVYRFVTNGWGGRGVAEFEEFVRRVKGLARPGELDGQTIRRYNGAPFTDKDLFNRVCAETRPPPHEKVPADEDDVVFHLLQHLELRWDEGMASVVRRVNAALSEIYSLQTDIDRARETLIGKLVERSGREIRMSHAEAVEFFLSAGVDPDMPRKIANLPKVASGEVQARLTEIGYDRAIDVREAVEWLGDKPILVITGESGNGKSWRLARLSLDLAQAHQVVTWAISRPCPDAQVELISDSIWSTALGQHESRTLAGIEAYIKKWDEKASYWLTAVVDDVVDAKLARDLASMPVWRVGGARLAISTSEAVAGYLLQCLPGKVQVEKASEFTFEELDRFLRTAGRSWSDLPDDLKVLLTRPILARMYATLPPVPFARSPKSEYEIFDRFWEHMRNKTKAGDEGVLLAIADRVLDKKTYPIPRADWPSGLDSESARRLIDAGWLKADDGSAAFAHDRLLNWSAARSLAIRAAGGAMTEAELATFLSASLGANQVFSRPLRYVFMDTFWHLSRQPNRRFNVGKLFEVLEADQHVSGEMYEGLLPTVGQPAVEWLIARLKAVAARGDARMHYLEEGLKSLAAQDQTDLRAAIHDLLSSNVSVLQAVALELIRVKPHTTFLDLLWALRAWHSKDGPGGHRGSTLWCDALRACVALDTKWLVNRIHAQATPSARMSDLAYVLAGLVSPDAPAIWRDVRHELISKLPPGRFRSGLYCIRRFSDENFAEECRKRLGEEEDFQSGAALSALARIDPDLALAHLPAVDQGERFFVRQSWLPELLEVRPVETLDRLAELVDERVMDFNGIGMLFESSPDDMGAKLLSWYLKQLEEELARPNSPGTHDWLRRPLGLLAGIADTNLLGLLRSRRGGQLEQRLTDVAASRAGNTSGAVDHLLEDARTVLLKIAGAGVSTLIMTELRSPTYWGRHTGLQWAQIVGDAAAEPLLKIALGKAAKGSEGDQGKMEFYLALRKLAAIQADDAIAEVIWTHGATDLPRELAAIRGANTMAAHIIERARVVLGDAAAAEDMVQRALAIAWMSGEVGLLDGVRPRLSGMNAGSLTAAMAAHLLMRLEDRSEEAFEFGRRLLLIEESRWLGVGLLIDFGPRGLDVLKEHTALRSVERRDHLDNAIIEALHRQPDTRKSATELAEADLSRGRGLFSLLPAFEVAADSANRKTQDQILLEAFSPDRTVVGREIEALRGVAHFDLPRALEAARKALVEDSKTADGVCQAVVEIADEDAALTWLIEAAKISGESLWSAIGRGLRQLPGAKVETALQTLSQSQLVHDRRASLHCASWCTVPSGSWMRESLMKDPEGRVRDEAVLALRRRRHLARSQALLAQLPSEEEGIQWSILAAIISSTPRQLLTRRNDTLWLGHALDTMPYRYTLFAEDQLKQRRDSKEPT